MKKSFKSIPMYFAMIFFTASIFGCETDGTETGDPGFTVQFSSFDAGQAQWYNIFIPKAFAQVSGIRMCIHQIRFKADNDSEDPGENANIKVGYVELDPLGTDLGGISVASGSYRRVDVMVKADCGEGFALSVTNDNGTYEIQGPQILRFEGDFQVDGSSENLILNLPNFISFFDSVASEADLENGVENINGSF